MIDQNTTKTATRVLNLSTLPRAMRLPEVQHITGLSRSTIYAMMEAGTFPRQRKASPTIAVWSESEVIAWVHALLAMPTDAKPVAA